jgi:hypothetical protein
VRQIHAPDLHIERPLRDLAGDAGARALRIRDATRAMEQPRAMRPDRASRRSDVRYMLSIDIQGSG